MKKWLILLLALSVISSVILGITIQASTLVPLINQSFLIGLFLLIVGSIAVVTRSGFFTLFLRGFKQLKGMFFRKPRMMDSDIVQANDPAFEEKKESFMRIGTSLFLTSGTGLIVFSSILTCFYYI
ncbi:DUF3899 domain-containing protein [Brevibacillus porteri]|uniref:DUF3899 domain-containing protein n=1 Tax=Brevibacillus brevis TaxID=1393 RepID=A0A517I8F5_BREBE|nr:DUF3899 domain-containing protein [Brevibacillus brevis]QDS35170.1 DUF3899 domain-containing protein [Brevibacillus brevis]